MISTTAAIAASLALAGPAAADPVKTLEEAGVDRVVVASAPGKAHAVRERVKGHLIAKVGEAEIVRVKRGTLARTLKRLNADRQVKWAEADAPVRGAADPLTQWGLETIAAPATWNETTGAGATVAVIDSGAALDHADLAGQWWINTGEKPGNRRDDDRNGKVDDWRGWDWVGADDNDPDDEHGHGTHTTGVLGAVHDNGAGIAGVAWSANVLPLRVLDANNSGYLSDVALAVRYAATQGVRIINASITGTTSSTALEQALRDNPEVLMVAAAGNRGADVDSSPDYPCAIPVANVVCVAATTANDTLASYSNYGATSVDLAAPGDKIVSACLVDYCTKSGTSMAAPHVAGVAALLAAKQPGASAGALKNALLAGVKPIGSAQGRTVSGGRLHAPGALAALGSTPVPVPEPTPTPTPTPTPDPEPATGGKRGGGGKPPKGGGAEAEPERPGQRRGQLRD